MLTAAFSAVGAIPATGAYMMMHQLGDTSETTSATLAVLQTLGTGAVPYLNFAIFLSLPVAATVFSFLAGYAPVNKAVKNSANGFLGVIAGLVAGSATGTLGGMLAGGLATDLASISTMIPDAVFGVTSDLGL